MPDGTGNPLGQDCKLTLFYQKDDQMPKTEDSLAALLDSITQIQTRMSEMKMSDIGGFGQQYDFQLAFEHLSICFCLLFVANTKVTH